MADNHMGYYRHPDYDGATAHTCGYTLHEHGWVDSSHVGVDGIAICPSSEGPFGGQSVTEAGRAVVAAHPTGPDQDEAAVERASRAAAHAWVSHDDDTSGRWHAVARAALHAALPPAAAPGATAPAADEGAQIVTLCGSTRFKDAFHAENQRLTMEGCLVISLGVFGHTDLPNYDWTTDASDLKRSLDRLHFQKIDMADRVHVVAPGGYVGESTRREIAHAEQQGKAVTWSDPAAHQSPAPVDEDDLRAAANDLDMVMRADADEAPITRLYAIRALQDRRTAGWRLIPPAAAPGATAPTTDAP